MQVTSQQQGRSDQFEKMQTNLDKFTIGIGAGNEGFDKIFLPKEK